MGNVFNVFRVMLKFMLLGAESLNEFVFMSNLLPELRLTFFIGLVLTILGVEQAEDSDGHENDQQNLQPVLPPISSIQVL